MLVLVVPVPQGNVAAVLPKVTPFEVAVKLAVPLVGGVKVVVAILAPDATAVVLPVIAPVAVKTTELPGVAPTLRVPVAQFTVRFPIAVPIPALHGKVSELCPSVTPPTVAVKV